jgi:hypothetical protein
MRSTNEIRFDPIFALTISRYSFCRFPEIGLDSVTDIERHKTADQISREISIQYLEDSADVYGPGRLIYTKCISGQGRPADSRFHL